jgi:hypothetical protein
MNGWKRMMMKTIDEMFLFISSQYALENVKYKI